MSSMQKRKGSNFERLAAELLNRLIKNSIWRRVAGSGAFGTIMSEPNLNSDVRGKVKSMPQEFKVECKVGYGGATQFALKKEWLDKIKQEADASYSIPILIGKFSGARDGSKVFVVMDIEVFADLINKITELTEELSKETKIIGTDSTNGKCI